MSDPFLGEIRLVPYNFAPRGWADCNGQLLPIAQYTALFSLLGTYYGGNGVTNFQLPNLQGRVAIHTDNANHVIGESAGSETVTLTVPQLPAHNHPFNATAKDEDTNTVTNNFLSNGNSYGLAPASTTMNAGSVGPTGNNQPHPNMQPYLTLRYIIALEGIYPSRS